MDGSAPSRCRPPATTSELEMGGSSNTEERRASRTEGVCGGGGAEELFERSVQSMSSNFFAQIYSHSGVSS